jgi:DNA-directed RNA polymerase subunit E'/Rpb7
MYIVKEMRNVVKIPPMLFDVPRNEAIANELNKKLANKVNKSLHHTLLLLGVYTAEPADQTTKYGIIYIHRVCMYTVYIKHTVRILNVLNLYYHIWSKMCNILT